MRLLLDTANIDNYGLFLKIKRLPKFRFIGNTADFPDEYAPVLGMGYGKVTTADYEPIGGLFDYQRDIAALAIRKRKFAVFADCGLGKTLIMAEFARHVSSVLPAGQCVLWVSPLMVVRQTIHEIRRFYGNSLVVEQVAARDLSAWMTTGAGRIGITNYDALTDDTPQGRIGAIILDESSMLKSMYGKWGQACIRLGRGVNWKLCGTGTPAPNDRIEYGNHAIFLDHFPTLNAFLARYFVNRGETANRWELKPHALGPFYRSLSHWCIFLTNPATYGWKDNAANIPPIYVHIHDVPLTAEQRSIVMAKTGQIIVNHTGGIGQRTKLSQIAKGQVDGESVATLKPEYIRNLVATWPCESTIIWCLYNHEQDTMERVFPDAASIRGETPYEDREALIAEFKAGRRKVLISKPKVLGFGLNLQIATRQVFSGLQDSYESYYQAVKRSNRVGSTKPLNVHIPVTEVERPMIETVLAKAHRVQMDCEEQERVFRNAAI